MQEPGGAPVCLDATIVYSGVSKVGPLPLPQPPRTSEALSHPFPPSPPLLTCPQTAFRARRCEGVLSRAALSEDTLAQALEALKLDLEAAGHSPAYGSQDFRMQLTR